MELKLRRCPICGSFPGITLHSNPNQASYRQGTISCICGHKAEYRIYIGYDNQYKSDVETLVKKWDKRDTDDILIFLQEAVKTISDDVLPYESDSFASLKEQIQDRIEYLTETITVQLEER